MNAILEFFRNTSPWVSVLTCVVMLLTGLLLGRRWIRRRARRGAAASRRAGEAGRAYALQLLAWEGYRVLQEEVVAKGTWRVGGRVHTFMVRADARVARGRRRYIAEFKREREGSASNRATRRQLLEYARVFPDHGLLLVDTEVGRVEAVEFGPNRAG